MELASVIIPTRNAAGFLPRLIAALRAQRFPPGQILVVDSSSPDYTAQQARDLGCEVMVIAAEEFRHGATRNLAALRSIGDPLVFMTQDALPANEGFLAELVAPIRRGEAVATFARQLPRPEAGRLERFDRAYHYPAHTAVARSEIRQYYFSDAASAIARSAFYAVGGFPPDTPSAEDRLLSKKLQQRGWPVQYTPAAQVVHSHALAPLAQLRRYFDFGATTAIAAQQGGAGGLGGEGIRYCGALARELRLPLWPQAGLDIVAKALGYWLGLHFRRLPPSWRMYLSKSPAWRRPIPAWNQDDPRVVQARALAAGARAGRS